MTFDLKGIQLLKNDYIYINVVITDYVVNIIKDEDPIFEINGPAARKKNNRIFRTRLYKLLRGSKY